MVKEKPLDEKQNSLKILVKNQASCQVYVKRKYILLKEDLSKGQKIKLDQRYKTSLFFSN